jgi:hypothetical protein
VVLVLDHYELFRAAGSRLVFRARFPQLAARAAPRC